MKYLSGSEKSYLDFLGFWAVISKISVLKNTGLWSYYDDIFCCLSSFSDISTLTISQMVIPKPISQTPFFSSTLSGFPTNLKIRELPGKLKMDTFIA